MAKNTTDKQGIWMVEILQDGKYVPTHRLGFSRQSARIRQREHKYLYPDDRTRVKKYVPED